jgi:hypothetical protein
MSLLNAYFSLYKQDILVGDKTIWSYLFFINPIKLNWNLIVLENIWKTRDKYLFLQILEPLLLMLLEPGQGSANEAERFSGSGRTLKYSEFSGFQNSKKFSHEIALNPVRRERKSETFRQIHSVKTFNKNLHYIKMS